jgi:hypothetical protein
MLRRNCCSDIFLQLVIIPFKTFNIFSDDFSFSSALSSTPAMNEVGNTHVILVVQAAYFTYFEACG